MGSFCGRPGALVLSALLAVGCASTGGSAASDSHAEPPVHKSPLGDELAGAVASGGLGRFDLTDAALIASGIDEAAALRNARGALESLVGPLIAQLESVADERERGRLLLHGLHAKGGPLGTYDARATTLLDILERRHFNCVSASVLYNVIAQRVRLDVGAQLLPTHARSLLSAQVGGRLAKVVVETTSPEGFDPDQLRQNMILAAVAGPGSDGRAIVSEKGEIVPTLVLIGTIYVNRASILQEAGKLEDAEHLFARGEALAQAEEMRTVLRDQRAALLSQLAADDLLSEDPTRFPRAYRTLKAAVGLEPKQTRIRTAVHHNLRAAAERLINLTAQKGDENGLLKLAGEAAALGMRSADRAGLRAFTLSEVARLRMDKGDADGAVEAIELALREQLAESDLDLRRTLEQNRVSTLRWAALIHAKKGDYGRSAKYIEQLEASMALSGAERKESSKDRLRVMHLVGNKRIDDADFEGAAEIYRECVRMYPSDETCRHNLVAALERLTMRLVEKADCAGARSYVEELRLLRPKSRFPATALSRCLMDRARERIAGGDFVEGVSLMRSALETTPSEKTVVKNLAVALYKWAKSLAGAGDCRQAKKLVEEIKSIARREFSLAELKAALGTCR